MLVYRCAKSTGKTAEKVLGDAQITVNKNAIPNTSEKPFAALGHPPRVTGGETTRGFKEEEARQVGHLVADVPDRPDDAQRVAQVLAQVAMLTRRFPAYG